MESLDVGTMVLRLLKSIDQRYARSIDPRIFNLSLVMVSDVNIWMTESMIIVLNVVRLFLSIIDVAFAARDYSSIIMEHFFAIKS